MARNKPVKSTFTGIKKERNMGRLRSFLKDEAAIAMIEYVLLGSLVATATLISWLFMGIDLSDSVDNIAAQI